MDPGSTREDAPGETISRWCDPQTPGGQIRLRFIALVCGLAALPSAAGAQPDDRPRFELHAGGGYIDARASVEQSPPSGITVEFGAVGWLTDRWGLAARYTRHPTAVYNLPPYDAGRRTWVDNANGRYTAITARYRRYTAAGIELNAGIGLFAGSYVRTSILRLGDDEERWFKRRVPGVGVTAELLLGYQLFHHLGVKRGVEVGGPWEMRFVQPRAVAVLSF